MTEPTAWRVQWQDYTGRRIGMNDEPPPIGFKDFATKEAAIDCRDRMRANHGPDLVLSIGPVFIKPPRVRRSPLLEGLPIQRKSEAMR